MDEQDHINCEINQAYRNVGNMVADITDRALLHGSQQRKNAIEQGFDTYRLKNHFDYSFCSTARNNIDLGQSFKKLGIGTIENAEKIQNYYQGTQINFQDDIVQTPNLSSCDQSQESDNIDYINEQEKRKNNPFYGLQRMSYYSSMSKSPVSNYKTDIDLNENGDNILQKLKTKNYLNIFYFIIKFKYLLKKFTSTRNIFTLRQHHFNLINDNSFGNQMVKKTRNVSIEKKIISILKIIQKGFTQLPVFDPSSSIVKFQEIFSFIMILVQIFYLPVRTSFQILLQGQYLKAMLETLPPFFFFFEIIFIFNKGFYKEGIAVVDRISVIHNYVKSDFLIDLFTTGLLFIDDNDSIYAVIFLIRMPQLQTTIEKIDESFQLSQKFPIAYQLIQLLTQIILVAHLCGCGFHYVGMHADSKRNWIITKELDNESVIERYVCSIYFAIIAMVTVGFGDVVPINMYEKIYVIIQTCFSCGIFAFAINTIGNIVKDKQQSAHDLKVNKNSALSYMKDRNISKQNQYKVIRYLEYSHKNQNDVPSRGKELIENMSKSVRDGVYTEFYNRVINQMPLFQNKFSQKFKQEIQQHLNESVYSAGDVIITQGKVQKNVYFIITGEVNQMIKMKESSLQKSVILQILKQVRNSILLFIIQYNKGDSFDEECFVSNLPSKYEYICKTVTQVAYIEKSIFEDIIQNFYQDYEIYCMLIHQIRLEGKQILQPKGCFSCSGKNHSAINCPLIHYEVNHELFLKRHISDNPQKRVSYHRKREHKKRDGFKTIHNQLRLLRLKLPKDYEIHDDEIFSPTMADTIDIQKILQLDDETFLTCSPKIYYSKSEQNILFLNDEDELDFHQEMEDEPENSFEELSMVEQNTSVSNSKQLNERNEDNRNIHERRNFMHPQKIYQEEQIPNQIQETIEEQEQDQSFGIDQDDKKYEKQYYTVESTEFSPYIPQKQFSIKNKTTQIEDGIISNNNNQQGKSKSLTVLNYEDQKDEIEEQEVKDQNANYLQEIIKDAMQVNQIHEGKKKKRTYLISNSLNLQKQNIKDLQNALNTQYSQKERQFEEEEQINNFQNYYNNFGNPNKTLSVTNLDDSISNFNLNQFPQQQGYQYYESQQIPVKLNQAGVSNSDRHIYIPHIQISPKKNDQDSQSRGQNRFFQDNKQKQAKQFNFQNSQANYSQNVTKGQFFQHQNQYQSQESLKNQLSTQQSLKNPIIQIQNIQQQPQKNFQNSQSQNQNPQQGNQYPMIINSNSNQKSSRISVHLNEPNNQTLSINNISSTQIREHSTYSKRSINSAVSISRSINSAVQPQTANSQMQNAQYQTQSSQSQVSQMQLAQNQYGQQQYTQQNHQMAQGQYNMNRQGSTVSQQNSKKHQIYSLLRQTSNTGTNNKGFPQQEIIKQNPSNLTQNNQNIQMESNIQENLSLQQKMQEQNIFMFEFELFKIFEHFFPHNNYDKVIEQIKNKYKAARTNTKRQPKVSRRQKKRMSVYQGNRKPRQSPMHNQFSGSSDYPQKQSTSLNKSQNRTNNHSRNMQDKDSPTWSHH